MSNTQNNIFKNQSNLSGSSNKNVSITPVSKVAYNKTRIKNLLTETQGIYAICPNNNNTNNNHSSNSSSTNFSVTSAIDLKDRKDRKDRKEFKV